MGSISEEQERVRNLLLDTVTLLCKNGLSFKKQLKVQGLLGITMDEDNVFIVHIDEKVGDVTVEHQKQDSKKHNNTGSENAGSKDSNTYEGSPERHKSRKRSSTSSPVYKGPPEKVKIKTEHFDDDLMLLDDKSSIPKVTSVHSANYNATSSGDMNNYGQYNQTMPNQYASMPTAFVSGVAPNASQLTEAPQGAGGSADKMQVAYFPEGVAFNMPLHRSKAFPCPHEGCSAAFVHKRTLRRHQNDKHGRQPRKRDIFQPVSQESKDLNVSPTGPPTMGHSVGPGENGVDNGCIFKSPQNVRNSDIETGPQSLQPDESVSIKSESYIAPVTAAYEGECFQPEKNFLDSILMKPCDENKDLVGEN